MKNMLRMTARQKLMHGFVQYIHRYGLRELELEERYAIEKHRKAKAKKLVVRKKEFV